jgi:hypothetical protein
MDVAREGGDRGVLNDTRLLVNEHVVKNIHAGSNSLFSSNPFKSIQKFIAEKLN